MRPTVRLSIVLALALTAALSTGPANAAIEVKGDGLHRTVDCGDGGRVVVTGSRNDLVFTGRCAKITLSGEGHHLRVAALGALAMSGLNHRVEWESAIGGGRPKVEDSGLNNSVVQVEGAPGQSAATSSSSSGSSASSQSGAAAGGGVTMSSGGAKIEADSTGVTLQAQGGAQGAGAAASGPMIDINGASIERTVECTGGGVSINGYGNRIVIRGECPKVLINGQGHHVHVEAVGFLDVNGDGQEVGWVRGANGATEPKVRKQGTNQHIHQIPAAELEKL
ncbi:MAG: DUF3060 domain-containing protein [Thermoanaerobaculia bacterium]